MVVSLSSTLATISSAKVLEAEHPHAIKARPPNFVYRISLGIKLASNPNAARLDNLRPTVSQWNLGGEYG